MFKLYHNDVGTLCCPVTRRACPTPNKCKAKDECDIMDPTELFQVKKK